MFSNISKPTLKRLTKLNAYHILVLSFLILAISFKLFLGIKQAVFLSTAKFPEEFAKRALDNEASWRSKVKTQLITQVIETIYELFDGCADFFIIYFGILPWLWQVSSQIIFTRTIADKSKPFRAEIIQSIVFNAIIALLSQLIKFPFSLINAFVGAKYGASLLTPFLQLVGAVIFSIISTAIVGTIKINLWHRIPYYFFGLGAVFEFLVIPLFGILQYAYASNMCTRLGTDSFGLQTTTLAEKLGFPVDRIFICSIKHPEAYFGGGFLPFTKHIVILQGLLDKFPVPAAVAVMGHEFGHWYHSHMYKIGTIWLLLILASTALIYWLAFKPGIYAALGFEPLEPQAQEEKPLQPTQNQVPHKSASKYKSWLMPYYLVSIIVAMYARPLILLEKYGGVAFIHMIEFQADRFGATHTRKQDMIDFVYLAYKLIQTYLPGYTGIADPFAEYCTLTHPNTVNRARALEEL